MIDLKVQHGKRFVTVFADTTETLDRIVTNIVLQRPFTMFTIDPNGKAFVVFLVPSCWREMMETMGACDGPEVKSLDATFPAYHFYN